jgi:hypothetical protein
VKYGLQNQDGSLNWGVAVVAAALLAATIWAIARSKAPMAELAT